MGYPLPSVKELVGYARCAERVARIAGKHIRDSIERREEDGVQIHTISKGGVDLVTEIDKLCEEIIIGTLKEENPTHCFVGEESNFAGAGSGLVFSDQPTWVIDPLDGTTNFVHGYTFIAVSIALAVNKVPVLGVIYAVMLDEMYIGWKGGGAYCNAKPIHVGKAKSIKDALLVNNIGSSRSPWFINKTLYRLKGLLDSNLQGLRMSGSAAMNLAHVACGKLDIYYEDGYGGCWDVAAGKVLVEEAGGVIYQLDGQPFVLKGGKGKVIAGNREVVREVVGRIKQMEGRMESVECSAAGRGTSGR